MKAIIFFALLALATPVFTASCPGAGSTTCDWCAGPGYSWVTAKTCTLCGNGLGRAADTAAPSADAPCTVNSVSPCNVNNGATGGAGCVNCVAGYYLSVLASGTTAGTCTMCPAGKGKAMDSTIPTADTTGATCTVASTGGCNVNNGATGGAGCINCAAGYYLSAAGTCTWCATGKGKAADTTVPTADSTGALCTAMAGGSAIANCNVYGGANLCASCATGFTLSTDMKTCTASSSSTSTSKSAKIVSAVVALAATMVALF